MPVLGTEQTEVKYVLQFASCHQHWQYVTLTHDFNKYEQSGLDYCHSYTDLSRRKGILKLYALGINCEAALKIPSKCQKKTLGTILLFGARSDWVHSRPFLVTVLKPQVVTTPPSLSPILPSTLSRLGVPNLGHENSWELEAPAHAAVYQMYRPLSFQLSGYEVGHEHICVRSAYWGELDQDQYPLILWSTLSRKAAERESCTCKLLFATPVKRNGTA